MDIDLKKTSLPLLTSFVLAWVLLSCTSASPPPPAQTTNESSNVETEETSGDLEEEEDDESDDEDDEEEEDDEEDEDEEDDEDTDPYAALVHQDKLKECHDDGKVYDRRTASEDDAGECHAAKWPAKFSCTKSGILGAFNNSQSIKDYVATQESDGFDIDQCGELSNGDPIVFYTKQDGTESAPELRVRVVEPQ